MSQDLRRLDGVLDLHRSVDAQAAVLVEATTGFGASGVEHAVVIYIPQNY